MYEPLKKIIIMEPCAICCRGTHFEREHDSLVAVSALRRCPSRVMSQSNVSYVPPGSDVSYVSPADRDANCPRFMFILSVTAALHKARASNLQHFLKHTFYKKCVLDSFRCSGTILTHQYVHRELSKTPSRVYTPRSI